MKSTNLQKAEQLGNECGAHLLNRLPFCKTETEASSEIAAFLQALSNERGRDFRNSACNGAAAALADALLNGMNAIPGGFPK
jgi:hypothetical protein